LQNILSFLMAYIFIVITIHYANVKQNIKNVYFSPVIKEYSYQKRTS